MVQKTLEQEFPFPKKLNAPSYKSEHEVDLLRSYQFIEILRYIIQNKARLEYIERTDSDDWKPGTLREFLRFATSVSKGDDPKQSPFQDYLKWWRIKRTPTRTELERIVTIDDKEEP